MPLELLRTPPPKERADAARNRAAVLDAAARLFAERGVEAVSMDQVAAAAGVGKGTLFRRFGDKAGLAAALLDVRERVLQQAILAGPPPLGPGAPNTERAAAFVDAYLDYLLEHVALVRMSETASPGARYRIGPTGSGTGTWRSCWTERPIPSTPRTPSSRRWRPSMWRRSCRKSARSGCARVSGGSSRACDGGVRGVPGRQGRCGDRVTSGSGG